MDKKSVANASNIMVNIDILKYKKAEKLFLAFFMVYVEGYNKHQGSQ